MNVRNNMFVASIPISVIAHRRVMFIGKTYCEKMTLNNISVLQDFFCSKMMMD